MVVIRDCGCSKSVVAKSKCSHKRSKWLARQEISALGWLHSIPGTISSHRSSWALWRGNSCAPASHYLPLVVLLDNACVLSWHNNFLFPIIRKHAEAIRSCSDKSKCIKKISYLRNHGISPACDDVIITQGGFLLDFVVDPWEELPGEVLPVVDLALVANELLQQWRTVMKGWEPEWSNPTELKFTPPLEIL